MVQISFETNFTYSSILLSDFNINDFTIRITEDSTTFSNNDLVITTESTEDLSLFQESEEVNLTHQASSINYTGALDGSIDWLGDTYDLIYNPIMLTSVGTSSRFVAFTGQNSVSGEMRRFLYREPFGSNVTATQQFWSYEDDGVEAIFPATNSVSNSTSNTRFYWTNSTNDPEIYYSRFRVNGSSASQTELSDHPTAPASNPDSWSIQQANAGHTIHSWSGISYSVVGSGSDTFGVIAVDHSGSEGDPFVVDHQDYTTGSLKATASARVDDDLFVISNGNLFKYLGDQDFVQIGEKLEHDVPGQLSPTVEGTYTGYYFTRMFYDHPSEVLYLVGDTAVVTGDLPATYTTQKIYKTDLTLSFITEIGTFDVGYYTNKDVFRIPDSQLYMFPGAYVTTMFDADTESLVDTRARLQDSGGNFDSTYQLTGGFKTSREAPIGYLAIKKSPANALQDYSGTEWSFVTVSPF